MKEMIHKIIDLRDWQVDFGLEVRLGKLCGCNCRERYINETDCSEEELSFCNEIKDEGTDCSRNNPPLMKETEFVTGKSVLIERKRMRREKLA